jgi:antitoxin (DNA-binding transcriptional repressor) of toxin-antitoxin stability system
MRVYTYSEARQNLARLLEEASGSGEVQIQRKDGSIFRLMPVQEPRSPFEGIRGISSSISREEIVAYVRESRES